MAFLCYCHHAIDEADGEGMCIKVLITVTWQFSYLICKSGRVAWSKLLCHILAVWLECIFNVHCRSSGLGKAMQSWSLPFSQYIFSGLVITMLSLSLHHFSITGLVVWSYLCYHCHTTIPQNKASGFVIAMLPWSLYKSPKPC